MKLAFLFLTAAFGAAKASLRGNGYHRTAGATESSSRDSLPSVEDVAKLDENADLEEQELLWERGNGYRRTAGATESSSRDSRPSLVSVAVLDEKSDLEEHELQWKLLLQRSIMSHDSAQNSRMLIGKWSSLNLWDYMEAVDDEYSPMYSKLMTLMTAAGKEDELRGATGVTLFAPDNNAFTEELETFLLAPENEDALVLTMEYHLVPSIVSYLSTDDKLKDHVRAFLTSAGENLNLTVSADGVLLNKDTRVAAFTLAKQALLYRVESILVPPSLEGVLPGRLVQGTVAKTDSGAAYEFPIFIPKKYVADSVETLPPDYPSVAPSDAPSTVPSDAPSTSPSDAPSTVPSDAPSKAPSDAPSTASSDAPSAVPSDAPSKAPSDAPSTIPSDTPSEAPSDAPSTVPSAAPSTVPSDTPSVVPSDAPSDIPSDAPSNVPTFIPTSLADALSEGNKTVTIDNIEPSDLGIDEEELRDLFSLFSKALSLFDAKRSANRDVTLFLPRGLFDADMEYGTNLTNPMYNLHLLSLVAYHITNGSLTVADFSEGNPIEMLAGGVIDPILDRDGIFAIDSFAKDPATVIASGEAKGVGFVNVIDQVLVPQWVTLNVMSLMRKLDEISPTYTTFRSLIVAAGMDDALRDIDDTTVFAPQNNAISQEMADFLLLPQNELVVTDIVNYHIISNAVINHVAVEAAEGGTTTLKAFQQGVIELSVTDQAMYVNKDAKVHAVALTRRAVVYRISKLLIPDTVIRLIPEELMVTGEAEGLPVTSDLEQTIVFPTDLEMLKTLISLRDRGSVLD